MPLRNYRAPEEGQTRGGAGSAVIRMSTKRMMTTTGITNWLLSSAWPASPTLNGNASFASLRSEKQVTIASRAAHVLFSVDLRPEGCVTKSTSRKRTHCKWRTRQQLGSTWADFGALFKHNLQLSQARSIAGVAHVAGRAWVHAKVHNWS